MRLNRQFAQFAQRARAGCSHVCSRMLTYAHVCSRMLTYAHGLRAHAASAPASAGKTSACVRFHAPAAPASACRSGSETVASAPASACRSTACRENQCMRKVSLSQCMHKVSLSQRMLTVSLGHAACPSYVGIRQHTCMLFCIRIRMQRASSCGP
jgi:hypothetical protein